MWWTIATVLGNVQMVGPEGFGRTMYGLWQHLAEKHITASPRLKKASAASIQHAADMRSKKGYLQPAGIPITAPVSSTLTNDRSVIGPIPTGERRPASGPESSTAVWLAGIDRLSFDLRRKRLDDDEHKALSNHLASESP